MRELRGELTTEKLASLSDKEVLDVALPLFLGAGTEGKQWDKMKDRRMCTKPILVTITKLQRAKSATSNGEFSGVIMCVTRNMDS